MFSKNNNISLWSESEQCVLSSTLSNTGPSQILPHLYVGCQEDALSIETMQDYQITHVINVSVTGERASFLEDNDDDEHFLRIPINDCLNAELLPYLNQAYMFIEKARLNNGHVFVHCLAGISRSPALVIGYIIRYLHLSTDDAYGYVKQRRPQISPNFNFLGQLYKYERSLSSNSPSTQTRMPLVRCITNDLPISEHCHSIQVEGYSNNMNHSPGGDSFINHSNSLNRPTCFNFDAINKRRLQTSLVPSFTRPEVLIESSEQQNIRTLKSRHTNETLTQYSSWTDDHATIPLINSSYDELMSEKPIEIIPESADTSSSIEQSDLINTYFQNSRNLSKSLEQWTLRQSLDLTSKTLTKVFSSSLEVFVL